MAEKIYLELSEDTGSHKFYEVNIDGVNVEIRYGRIGTDGQKQSLSFADEATALKEANKKVNEKVKKGYERAVMGVRKKRTVTRRFVEATPSGSSSSSSGRTRSAAPPQPKIKLPADWLFNSGSMAFGIYIDADGCWVGNQEGRVFKLSHEGEVKTQYKLPEGVKCLVVDSHWIYAGCDNGNVYDLNGKIPRVAYEISEEVDIFWLDVSNGHLGVSDNAGYAAMFDYEDNLLWRVKGKGDSAWMIRCNFNGQAFYGDTKGVSCFNPDGSEAWHTKTRGQILFGYQDKYVLYVGTTASEMHTIGKNGKIIQTFACDASMFSCAATDDGKYVFGGDNNAHVYCFDTEGNRLWKLATGYGSVLSMQYFQDKLYIVTTQGYLACIDVSEAAIEKAKGGEAEKVEEIATPQAVVEVQSNVLEVAQANAQGIRLKCVKEGGKLRVRVESEGYHKDWYVQFPKDLRTEGGTYIVDDIKESAQGGFYRVLGNIFSAS